ncbi:MAG: hypothetical protein Q4G23_09820, partial [Clostridia bacterium]|nr:hypothetical protein [Clostridia bacterium]
MTDTKIGSLKFYSNDGDKNYDIIFVDSYKTAVINGKIASSGIIKFKYGEDDLNVLYSDPDKDIYRTVSILKNSKTLSTIELSDLREYDIIDYKESIDKDFLTAEITPAESTAVTGSFIKLADDKIQIRNKTTDKKVEYELNYNYIDYLENYSGDDKFVPQEYDNVKLYFNADGKVAAIEEIISTADSKYGYITMLAYKNADGSGDEQYIDASETPEEGDKVAMMLYQVDPSKSTIGSHTSSPILVDSSVRVDGVIIKNNPEEVMTRLLKAAELANEGKEAPLNKNTAHSSFIRYEMSGGQIITLDTVLNSDGKTLSTESDERFNTLFRSSTFIYDDNGEDEGRHVYYGGSSSSPGFYKKSSTYSTRVKLYNNSSKSTLIFVPGNRSDTKYYSASKFIYTNFYHGMKYYIEAYNVSGNYAEFLLQYVSDGKDVVTSFSTMAVVTATEDENNDDPDLLKIKYRTAANSTENTITLAKGSPAAEKYDDLNVGDVILFSTALDKTMYDFYHALDITNLPHKRVDDPDLLYCDSENSDRRINGFDIYPTGTKKFSSNAEYRTIYGTAISYENTGTGTVIVNPMLATDYFEEMDETLNEEHNFASATKLFVYDEEEEKVTMYSSSTTAKSYLKENLFTEEKYGYEDADKLFIYTTNSSVNISAGEPVVKFIYLIRTASQKNPGNYEGVETPEVDPLADAKAAAKAELTEYIEDIDVSLYSLVLGIEEDIFSDILSDGKTAISAATTEDGIEEALTQAKAKADNVPDDSYIEDAKSRMEGYIDIIKYPDAESIVADALDGIDASISKVAIESIIESACGNIDDAVLTLVFEDKKAELDEYISGI